MHAHLFAVFTRLRYWPSHRKVPTSTARYRTD